MRVELASSETPASFLDGFVRIRNEAAHGAGSSLVSANEILKYADFVVLIVDALAALLRTHLLRAGLTVNRSIPLGDVIHVFSRNVVGIRSSSNETINVGDILYAGKKRLEPIAIISLRILKDDHASIDLNPGFEFGAKLDRRVPAGSEVLRWLP